MGIRAQIYKERARKQEAIDGREKAMKLKQDILAMFKDFCELTTLETRIDGNGQMYAKPKIVPMGKDRAAIHAAFVGRNGRLRDIECQFAALPAAEKREAIQLLNDVKSVMAEVLNVYDVGLSPMDRITNELQEMSDSKTTQMGDK
jgi:hypothetical protein